MNEEENLFHEATIDYGGILKTDDYWVNHFRDRSRNIIVGYQNIPDLLKSFPKIICNIVDNDSINAFALKHEDVYVVAFHKGLLYALQNVIAGLFSDESVFSSRTKDETLRGFYSMHLFGLAMDFILEHELSHIFCGHLDYWCNEFDTNALLEIYFTDEIKNTNFDRQTFEMDSDCTALTRLCMWANNVVTKDPRLFGDYFGQFYTNQIHIFSDLFVSISIIFRLFGDGDFRNVELGTSHHPNPRIRQLILFLTFHEINKVYDLNIDSQTLYEQLSNKFVQVDIAFEEVFGQAINIEVFSPEYYADHPMLTELQKNWEKNLRSKLTSFAYFPLA